MVWINNSAVLAIMKIQDMTKTDLLESSVAKEVQCFNKNFLEITGNHNKSVKEID